MGAALLKYLCFEGQEGDATHCPSPTLHTPQHPTHFKALRNNAAYRHWSERTPANEAKSIWGKISLSKNQLIRIHWVSPLGEGLVTTPIHLDLCYTLFVVVVRRQ